MNGSPLVSGEPPVGLLRHANIKGRVVLAAGALLTTTIIAAFVVDLSARHDEFIKTAERQTLSMAAVAAESTRRAIATIDLNLHDVIELKNRASIPIRNLDHHDTLKTIVRSSPLLQALGWVDADGNRLTSSLFAEPPPLNVADAPQFRVHAERDDAGLYIGAPLQSRLLGTWMSLVTRRIDNPDGSFGGIVSGIIDPVRLGDAFSGANLGRTQGMSIVHLASGAIMARVPHRDEWIGRSVSASAAFQERMTAGEGNHRMASVVDGAVRIMGFKVVPGTPLVVFVTIDQDEALEPWRRYRLQVGTLVGLLCALLLGGSALLYRQFGRDAWAMAEAGRREAALAAAREDSERAHRRLTDAIESLNDGFALYDKDDRLVTINSVGRDWNPRVAAVAVPGAHYADIVRAAGEAGIASSESGGDLDAFVARRLREFREPTVTFQREISGRWYQVRHRPTSDGGMVLLRTDITELKRREAELAEAHAAAEAAREEAEAASRAKSEFLASMSHELRTPLNSIIGFAQMMEMNRERNLSANQMEAIGFIHQGGKHLLNLVSDILDLVKIEAGRLMVEIETVRVADSLADVRSSLEPMAARRGISLTVDSVSAIPDIRADAQRLRQVLMNLVSNAIKYNRTGGSVSISAHLLREGYARLVVADTGVGIASEKHGEVFEPFQRLGAEFSTIEGTGIGLAIAKRLAEAMNGSIGFSSATGIGSTFWCEFPLAAPLGETRARPVDQIALTAPRAASGGYTVLYIEDNPASLRLMEHVLRGIDGVRMLAAPEARLGLELATDHRPDVIILDLNLPGMSGYEALKQLKAMPQTRHIPVVALTAAAMPADVKRGEAAGFFRYLTKPMDVELLLSTIDEALRSAPDADKLAARA